MATKKDTSKMPKTKRNLGATDAGQAQRTGGFKAAGTFFAGADATRNGPAAQNGMARNRMNKLKSDTAKKTSKGSSAKKK